jgi:hypothetical protein
MQLVDLQRMRLPAFSVKKKCKLVRAGWTWPDRTRVRICAETYGFARQKTRGGSMNLILISWMSFLVDFRPQIAF